MDKECFLFVVLIIAISFKLRVRNMPSIFINFLLKRKKQKNPSFSKWRMISETPLGQTYAVVLITEIKIFWLAILKGISY